MQTKTILHTTILACLSAGLLGTAHAITLQTVTIGDPGNPNDPDTGGLYGGVAATYAIGKYEVTLTQYTAFLSAVAVTDTYALYNTAMGTDLNIAGISRTGSSGSYSYAVLGDGARPVTYVSWFDAARFSNWLHNGQPTGLQVAGTTEQGAYTLNGAVSGIILKNAGAQDWIPSESEWYKAAYYQPAAAGGDADGYWLYPTRSNSVPGNNIGGAANQGNLYDGVDFSVTQSGSYSSTQNYLTAGGAYTNSASYYGTFDQGGNVNEWNDAVMSPTRGLRGGSWNFGGEFYLRASGRNDDVPTDEASLIGFRIATVPEPTVSVSLMLAGGMLLSRRKRPSAL